MASRLRPLGSPLGVFACAATLALANPASATDDQHSQADQSNYEGSGLIPCLHCDDPSTVAVPRVERDASQNCTTEERFEGQWKPFVKICGARGDVSLAVPFPSIIKGRPGPNSDTATITLRAEGFEGDKDYCVKRPHNIEIAGTIPVAYGFTWTLPSDWNVVTLDCSMEPSR